MLGLGADVVVGTAHEAASAVSSGRVIEGVFGRSIWPVAITIAR